MQRRRSKRSGKRTLLVDTSVLIAFLVQNDPHHDRARKDLSTVDIIYVPVEVLLETALFFRRHNIPFHTLLEFIASEDVIVVDTTEDDVIAALRATEKSPRFFVDYLIYNASVRLGAPFLTYDEEFQKQFLG